MRFLPPCLYAKANCLLISLGRIMEHVRLEPRVGASTQLRFWLDESALGGQRPAGSCAFTHAQGKTKPLHVFSVSKIY